MRTMIVDCSGFVLKHPVAIQDSNEIVHLTTTELAGYAVSKNVDKIILSGITEYCNGVRDEIKVLLALEYANHNIEIEVL